MSFWFRYSTGDLNKYLGLLEIWDRSEGSFEKFIENKVDIPLKYHIMRFLESMELSLKPDKAGSQSVYDFSRLSGAGKKAFLEKRLKEKFEPIATIFPEFFNLDSKSTHRVLKHAVDKDEEWKVDNTVLAIIDFKEFVGLVNQRNSLTGFEISGRLWKSNKRSSKYLIQYADALLFEGKSNQAIDLYIEALNNNGIRNNSICRPFGNLLSRCEKVGEVYGYYEWLFNFSKSQAVKLDFCQWLVENGMMSEAENYLSKVEVKGSKRKELLLAKVEFAKGNTSIAIQICEEIISKTTNNSDVWEVLREFETKSSDIDGQNSDGFIKHISFKPEHHAAGLAILQNFGRYLSDKYPNGDVAFTIKQDGLKVTMVIEHPHGEHDVIEDYLNSYGLVVAGKLLPEDFTSDPMQILDLKRQLHQFESEMKWEVEKRRMLEGVISKQDSDIEIYQKQISDLQGSIMGVLARDSHIDRLLDLVGRNDKTIEMVINKLVQSSIEESESEVREQIVSMESRSPSALKKVKEFVTNTMASASGNAPAWIDFLSKLLP